MITQQAKSISRAKQKCNSSCYLTQMVSDNYSTGKSVFQFPHGFERVMICQIFTCTPQWSIWMLSYNGVSRQERRPIFFLYKIIQAILCMLCSSISGCLAFSKLASAQSKAWMKSNEREVCGCDKTSAIVYSSLEGLRFLMMWGWWNVKCSNWTNKSIHSE